MLKLSANAGSRRFHGLQFHFLSRDLMDLKSAESARLINASLLSIYGRFNFGVLASTPSKCCTSASPLKHDEDTPEWGFSPTQMLRA